MENCNLLLLCNTSNAESEMKKQDKEQKNDTNLVQVKEEVDDGKSKDAATESSEISGSPQPVAEAVAESMAAVTDKWAVSQANSTEENCNNNRLSLDGSTVETVVSSTPAITESSKAPTEELQPLDDNSLTRKKGTLFSAEGTDDSNSLVISIHGSDISKSDASTLESSCSSSSNVSPLDINNKSGALSGKGNETISFKCKNVPEDSSEAEQNTSTDEDRSDSHLPNSVNYESSTGRLNGSGQDDTVPLQGQVDQDMIIVDESTDKHQSENTVQFSISQQHYETGPEQQVPTYVQIDGNCVYEAVQGMDTLAETAMSQQMSIMQQQALEHAQYHLPQQTSMGRSVDAGWNHSAPDASFGCPIASSTPEVDGRRFAFLTQENQAQDSASFIHTYQPLPADSQSWQVQTKQGYPEHEQLHWITNGMTAGPHSHHEVMTYDLPVASDRNWPGTSEAMSGVQNNVHANPPMYMYPPQQTAPLDMSPASEAPQRCPTDMIQSRKSFSSEMVRDTVRPVKRSHSSSCLDSGNDIFHQEPKVPKVDAESQNSTGENYQISTNVHTLKPRHMVAWYIDHLLQENENVTQISKSYSIPVNIFNSKDMYFMEAVLKKVNFPSPKFLNWMQSNFPNINIHAVDFSEGRRPYYYIPYEDQIQGKKRDEIIKDTFFYFQQRKMH